MNKLHYYPTIIFILLLSSIVSVNAQTCPIGDERIESINPDFELEVVRFTNIERKKVGVAPLEFHELLAYAARYHAEDMVRNSYFSHESAVVFDNGDIIYICNTRDRVGKFLTSRTLGENIASGQLTPKKVVADWMTSKSHKRNILSSKFKHIGVGYYKIKNDTRWVQNFIE